MIKVCPICGAKFETTQKRVEQGRGKYCSKKCQILSLKKQIEVKCSICGKQFFIRNSKYLNNKTETFYCNECWEKRKTKKIKTCSICGKSFADRKRKYCSNECANKAKYRRNDIIIKDNYAEILINSPKYGEHKALIDVEDVEKVKNFTWGLKYCKKYDLYYAVSSQHNKCEVKLHRYLTNCPKDLVVDHINHNGLDNRKQNLRICEQKINSTNVRISKKNTSGNTGIMKTKNNKFKAYYAKQSLGVYNTEGEAIFMREQYLNHFIYKEEN